MVGMQKVERYRREYAGMSDAELEIGAPHEEVPRPVLGGVDVLGGEAHRWIVREEI